MKNILFILSFYINRSIVLVSFPVYHSCLQVYFSEAAESEKFVTARGTKEQCFHEQVQFVFLKQDMLSLLEFYSTC